MPVALKVAFGLFAVGIAAFLFVVFAATYKPDPSPWAAYRTGALKKLDVATRAPQPTRAFVGPDGASMTLADFDGGVTLVNLWATWCAPCLKEMPTLAALERAAGGDAFRVVPISIDKPAERAKAERMLAKLSEGALPFYHEPTGGLAFDVNAPGLPTTILYDRNGREIARVAGDADWSSPEARALVDAVAGVQ